MSRLREVLQADIEACRKKADFYRANRLFEAAHYAGKLAENLELALTTLPRDEDPQVA